MSTVRLSDVARAAGVSVATASRALNRNATVNPELAARVFEQARVLGYQVNAMARNLRTQHTRMWALVISDITNPFFTSLARGVEDVARERGYSVFVGNTDEDPGREHDYLSVAIRERVAGIVVSPHSAELAVDEVRDSGIPVVVVDRHAKLPVDAVVVDSRSASTLATEHLLSAGWLRPGCITGPADAETAVARADGYRAAIARHEGLEPVVVHGPFRVDAGERAADQLLDAHPDLDSLLVGNAALALGVLAAVRRRGLVVGRDIGIVAFDDAPWAVVLDPPLTVVAQPAYEVGRQAALVLAECLAGKAPAAARTISLSAELIVRGSSLRA